MNPKLLLRLALVLSGGWFGCSTTAYAEETNTPIRVAESPVGVANSTNYWERFLAGIESDDFKNQGDVLMSYVWDGPPNDSAVPSSIAYRAVPRLVELGQIYFYSTNYWVFATNAPLQMAYVAFIVHAIPQMGSFATNALPWLEKMLISSDASEDLKVQIFFTISSIAPNSEVEWRAITYCLHSRQDNLFVTGAERFSHSPAYLRSVEFLPLMTGLLQLGNQTPKQKEATIQALGCIGSAIKMIHQESDPKYRGGLTWNLNYNYKQILSPDDVQKISNFLFDPDELVRVGAVSVLGQIGTNAIPAKAALQRAEESGDMEMKREADKILNYLTSKP